MKIKKISGTGHIKIKNWQQRMELLGYRLDCFKTNDYSNGKKMDDSFVISCDLSDYLSLKKIRKKYWDNRDKMTKRIKKLPKKSFKDELLNFNSKNKLKYYRKVFSL